MEGIPVQAKIHWQNMKLSPCPFHYSASGGVWAFFPMLPMVAHIGDPE